MAPPQGRMFYKGLYRKRKKILPEATRPRALIFGMKHHLVDLYQVCSNNAPGWKWPCPRGHIFYVGLYRKHMKTYFCLKQSGLESWYFVCSITYWTSTKFVQILPIRSKMAPPRGTIFYIGLYSENMKKYSCLKPQGLESDIWYVASSSRPLLSLFKLYPWGQKWAPGVTFLHQLI